MYPQNADDLADRIRAAHIRQINGRDEWVEATLELAALFAEGRARWTDNRGFSYWLVEHDLGFTNDDDRAAYIKLGQNLDAARDILEETKSTSVQLIVRKYADRLRNATNTTEAMVPLSEIAVAPVETPTWTTLTISEEVILAVADPEPEPQDLSMIPVTTVVTPPLPLPRSTLSLPNKHNTPVPSVSVRISKYIPALGTADKALEFVKRIEGPTGSKSNLQYLFSKILQERGGKTAIKEAAELLEAHPHWVPAYGSSSALSARCFNTNFSNKNGWPVTVAGLKKAMQDASDYEASRRLPPVNERAVTPTSTPVSMPGYTPSPERLKLLEEHGKPIDVPEFGKPFESPREDEDIVVYGTVIRRKGEKPEFYQRVWSMVRYLELFDFYLAVGEPKHTNRGANYAQMGHFFRDAHGETMGLYWNQWANAIRVMKDPGAKIQMAHRTYRLK